MDFKALKNMIVGKDYSPISIPRPFQRNYPQNQFVSQKSPTKLLRNASLPVEEVL